MNNYKFSHSSASVPQDSESNLNTLLSQLGPAKTDNEEEIKGARVQSGSREAMVGGLVNCLLIPADKDRGRQELRGGFIQGASLQRIASRCQCNVIYVSYGGQAEPETCDSAILTVSAHTLPHIHIPATLCDCASTKFNDINCLKMAVRTVPK